MKTKIQFIDNRILKIVYMQNGNKLDQGMVVYLWEEMWQLQAFELFYNNIKELFIIEKQWKTLNIQKT